MTIAESLKRFRKEFNLSQKQVAQTLGIKQPSYQIYEANTKPSAEVIKRIAVAFRVSADYLLGISNEPRPVPADKIMIEKIAGCRDSIQELLAMVDKATRQVSEQ